MLEVFKIVVLCLICTVFTALFSTVLLTTLLFITLTALFYDFDFETPFERHAINKIKHAYLKVRNIYQIVYPNTNQSNLYIYTPNMSNINKDFDLSRFNRSGSVFSPISRIGSAAGSRRLSTQTSTPLTRNSPWQKNSSTPVKSITLLNSTVSRSPRYSLSSSNDNPIDVKSANQSPTVQTVAGPLLASTRFNINLGTYTDTKSPGLASRVVQYHNESQTNEAQTHQSKYKSPGQFPIVQLYKKKLPLITRTPKRCTVRVAPPDCVTYNSPEGNQILRETFLQQTVDNSTQHETEINTKSVLDALKEISRKRIHANDDLDDISKRQRKGSVSVQTNSDNTNKDGKRLREDTPPKPKGTAVSPATNKPKKICVTDEIECSLSSSIFMRQKGQKRKAAISGEKLTNTVKQRKISSEGNHISRETQTNMQTNHFQSVTHSTQTNFTEPDKQSNVPKKATNEEPTEEKEYTGLQQILQNAKRKKKQYFEKSIEEIDEERSSVQFNESLAYKPLFSHEPMEIIMKNRLEVAMSALNGDKPEIIPLPKLTLTQMLERHKELVEKESINALKESKALTSILSPKNKSKHDRHVSFDIPSDTSKINTDTDSSQIPAEKTLTNENISSALSNLPMTPVSEPRTPEKSPFGVQISFGAVTNTTISNNTTPTPLVKDTPQPSPQLKFGESKISFGGDATSKTPAFSTLATSSTPNLTTNTNFGALNNTSSTSLSFGVSSSNGTNATLPFGTNLPISTVSMPFLSTPNTQSDISFGTVQTTSEPNSKSVVSFGTTVPSSNTLASTITSSLPSPPNTKTGISFGTQQPVSFGSNTTNTAPPSFGSTTAITAPPAFGSTTANTAPPSFGSTIVNTAPPSFGATIASTAPPAFGVPPQTTQNAVSFATATTSTSGFSFNAKSETNSTASFNFGGVKSPPKTGGFKFDLGKPVASANEPPKSSSIGDISVNKPATFSFGTTNSNTSSASVFGASNSTPAFGGISTTSVPAFGAITNTQSTPIFGNTDSKPVAIFGATPNNSDTSVPVFGLASATNTTSTTSSSVFGAPSSTSVPAFGAPKTTENNSSFAFGAPTTQTTQNPGFAFGGAQPKPPVTTTVSTSANSFNFGGAPQNNNNKPFSFNATTTTAGNVFGGAGAPPAFGATSQSSGVFGAPTTTSGGGFASNTTSQTSNVFGTPSTTSAVFGSNTSTTTANTFGQPSSSAFGSASSGFGAPSANGSSFTGSQTSTNTFGNSNATSASFVAPNQAPFASGAANNVFGGNSGAQTNVFGSPNTNKPGFGTANPPGFAGGFGNANTPAPAFGANAAPTNNNVFGSNTNQTPTFGASNNNNNNNQPAAGGFGTFGAPNQTAPQQGVFAFGGAAPNPAAANAFQFGGSNTPAKPGGFNFSNNTTTPNLNFTSGNPTPNFGTSPPPGFGAPSTGMFSIGSGSTAPKQRPMIKARRRNN